MTSVDGEDTDAKARSASSNPLPVVTLLLGPVVVLLVQGAVAAQMPVLIAASVLVGASAAVWVIARARVDRGARTAAVGMLAGAGATLAYDLSRALLATAGLGSDPFRTIGLYGEALVPGSPLSSLVGWLFHAWNGVAFGAFYTVAFGTPTILKGIAWGLFLELAQVASSPRLLGLTIEGEILALSGLGHLAYGFTLAVLAKAVPNDSRS